LTKTRERDSAFSMARVVGTLRRPLHGKPDCWVGINMLATLLADFLCMNRAWSRAAMIQSKSNIKRPSTLCLHALEGDWVTKEPTAAYPLGTDHEFVAGCSTPVDDPYLHDSMLCSMTCNVNRLSHGRETTWSGDRPLVLLTLSLT
jgi:hypothetical protein